MKLTLKARDWHNWVSVLLLVPTLLVGLTAVFLAHRKELRLNEFDLTPMAARLPGYGGASATQARLDLRASLATTDGWQWIGTPNGLYRILDGHAQPVPELAGEPVRGLAAAPWGLVAAARNGIWIERGEGWHRVHKGDAWNASANPDGSVTVALRNEGLLVSREGRQWRRDSAVTDALAALPPEQAPGERITLGRLMFDLHTGRALLGREGEWIWIDLLGGVWVFLGFTGLYLWWRAQTKRRDAAHNRAAHG
ncbi:MAG: hypothetical protein HYZ19_01880 [Rhodocyclales bacterium]|nr:hypothetical protein [Rhodocyclales bacterium]